MADRSIDLVPTFYTEDIAITGSGSIILNHPAMLWTMVFDLETSGTAIISFSDDATGYNPSHRIGKEVLVGPKSEWRGFSKGLNLTRGLSMIANLASVDVWGVAE